jgi:hypothetical protein
MSDFLLYLIADFFTVSFQISSFQLCFQMVTTKHGTYLFSAVPLKNKGSNTQTRQILKRRKKANRSHELKRCAEYRNPADCKVYKPSGKLYINIVEIKRETQTEKKKRK